MLKLFRLEVLETLMPLVLVLLLLYLIFSLAGFLYGAVGLLTVALFIRPLAELLAGGWLRFAKLLAAVNAKVLLTILYYLLLTPVALLFRLFNRNPLQLKAAQGIPSYYTICNHHYSGNDLTKTW
jgi:hypothetical protein